MSFNLNALNQAISSLKSNISASYTACQSKGATIPSVKNSTNLPECIMSIPTNSGGSTPSVEMNAQSCSHFNVTWAEITDPTDVPQQFTIDFSQIGEGIDLLTNGHVNGRIVAVYKEEDYK